MWLNIFISAVIGIISFLLATLSPRSSRYFQVPMEIIGKVYANSMLVLINSRMVLGSAETPSTVISVLRFGTTPTNPADSIIEGGNGDLEERGQDLREVQSLRHLKVSAE
jgi:hypothetical protein